MAAWLYGRVGELLSTATVAPQVTNFALNQSTDAIEFIFQAPPGLADYVVTRLGFRQGTIAGTAPTYRVSLQGVDSTTGYPDGTIKASAGAYVDYTPSAPNNNTWQWVTLGSTYTASPGELLAMVLKYQSGTIDGSNNVTFTYSNNLGGFAFPYGINTDAGTRSKNIAHPTFGWGTASLAHGFPASAWTTVSFNSGSSPSEYALRFKLPVPGAQYTVRGVRVMATPAAGHTLRVTLYSGTSVLQQVDVDGDNTSSAAASRYLDVFFDETTLTTLTGDTEYRIGFAPQDSTNWTLPYMDVAAAADLDAWPLGRDWYTSTRAGGAWSDTTTRRLLACPVVDTLNPAAGKAARNLSIGSAVMC